MRNFTGFALVRAKGRIPLWHAPIAEVPPAGVEWGIRTGEPSGIWVLDIDRKNGVDGERSLAAAGIVLPPTLEVATQSGGRHLYFRLPDGLPVHNRTRILDGVDVRGRGGFVVGPGSPGYTLRRDVAPVDAPAELLALVVSRRAASASPPIVVPPLTPADPRWAVAIATAARIVSELPPAPTGQRDHALYRCACDLVEHCNLPDDVMTGFLAAYAARFPEPPTDLAAKAPGKFASARRSVPLPWGPVGEPPPPISDVRREPPPPPAPGAPPPPPAPPEREFTKEGKLKVSAALPNQIRDALSLDPLWAGGRWVFDVVHGAPAFDGEAPVSLDARYRAGGVGKIWGPSKSDVFRIRAWLGERYGYRCQGDDVLRAITEIASRTPRNPIAERLTSLRDRDDLAPLDLAEWARETLSLATEVEGEAVRRWLIAAVRRGIHPGTIVQTVLILAGDQGTKKSSFFQALFGAEWVRDTPIRDFEDRDALMGLRGFWCIEFAELQSLLRNNLEATKGFLTQNSDDFREFNGAGFVRQLRSCVFCGTTNDRDFLRDPTGSRRFWPVRVRRRIDLAAVQRDADRVWRAALLAAEAGDPHWWDDEPEDFAEVKADLESVDPWAAFVANWILDNPGVAAFTTQQVLEGAIFPYTVSARERMDNRTAGRVKRILARFGAEEVREAGRRVWRAPGPVLAAASRVAARSIELPPPPAGRVVPFPGSAGRSGENQR